MSSTDLIELGLVQFGSGIAHPYPCCEGGIDHIDTTNAQLISQLEDLHPHVPLCQR